MENTSLKASMIIFILLFVVIYGGMHLYIYLKAKTAFNMNMKWRVFVMLFLVSMTFSPIAARMFDKNGLECISRLLSYAGFFWMAFLFLFFSISLVFDLYYLINLMIGLMLKKSFALYIVTSKISFYISSVLSILIIIYGYFEAKNIEVNKVEIYSPKIHTANGEIRIVQISDIHLGMMVNEKRLRIIIEKVKEQNPDVLVSTGDLVDSNMKYLNGLEKLFAEINPKYGKYAVTGNHEFYAGLEEAIRFTEMSGFKLLRGEGKTVKGVFNIAGVDDRAGKMHGGVVEVSEKDILKDLPKEKFTVLLKHTPIIDKEAIGLYDLQLSGHTHSGQIFPFSLITRLVFPLKPAVLHRVGTSYFYLNRGTGTWGPPVRFLARPEITVFDIKAKKD